MNNSSTIQIQNPPCSHTVSSLFIAIMTSISVAAIIGNVLVTVVCLKTPSLRTITNYYIVNMAVSDLLCACFNWPLYATEGMLTRRKFITGSLASAVCKLGMYSRGVSQVVSVLSLVLIAVDRYIAIVFPLKSALLVGKNKRVMLLFITWFVPVVCGIPYIVYTDTVKEENHTFCRTLWGALANMIFNVAGFVVFYCTPLILMAILYIHIVKTLRKRKEMQGSASNKREQQHRKITKILISIVVAFFICWTPLCVYLSLKMFHPDLFLEDECKTLVALFFYVFPSLSTAINPIILFSLSTNFRQALESLGLQLCRFFQCCSILPSRIGSSRSTQITQAPEDTLDAANTENHRANGKRIVLQKFHRSSRRVSNLAFVNSMEIWARMTLIIINNKTWGNSRGNSFWTYITHYWDYTDFCGKMKIWKSRLWEKTFVPHDQDFP